MAGKTKFQFSKTLDDRIKHISEITRNECDSEYSQLKQAYILGFHVANVTNYVGITKDYEIYSSGYQVTGLVYFGNVPNEADIGAQIKPVREYYLREFGTWEGDKNEHLYLIYWFDEETKQPVRKVFDSNAGQWLPEQPKLSVLDSSKIYNHSAVTKFQIRIDVRFAKTDKIDKIYAEIDRVQERLQTKNAKNTLLLELDDGLYSSKAPLDDYTVIESLYDTLEVPREVDKVNDYLPHMTKEEKKKFANKWRNKVKGERAPLNFDLYDEALNTGDDDTLPGISRLCTMHNYLHLHVNDSIAKGISMILFMVRQRLEQIRRMMKKFGQIDPRDLKSCSFKPKSLDHFVQLIYPLPTTKPNYKVLAELREQIHDNYLLPKDRPIFRYSQRVLNVNFTNSDEDAGYLCDIHTAIADKSPTKGGIRNLVQGTYTYHHYQQDKVQDSGWGCAYRSLQTIISWLKHQGYIYTPDVANRTPKPPVHGDKSSELRQRLNNEARVPTHQEIQTVLINIGDKPPSFLGTEKWIGSQEVCYVLNNLYNIDSKFISVSSGSELVEKARDLGQHFATQCTPVMVGGGVLAHTIIGVDFNEKNGDISYLILDPHYVGAEDISVITKKGGCGWKKNSFWDPKAFYNLCLPQRPMEI